MQITLDINERGDARIFHGETVIGYAKRSGLSLDTQNIIERSEAVVTIADRMWRVVGRLEGFERGDVPWHDPYAPKPAYARSAYRLGFADALAGVVDEQNVTASYAEGHADGKAIRDEFARNPAS